MSIHQTAKLRETVWQLHDFIGSELILNRPDIELGSRALNTTLLISVLTALCQGKGLIIGEPGLGKTTCSEYLCALMYRIPLEIVWRSVVAGHPEQTEEKIIGRPDLGRLNQGEEVVVWSYFSLLPVKIVDELNRLPETKQALILDGLDRGKWDYLNDGVINEEYCLYATANYEDEGTNTIIAPLCDRFDTVVEARHPGPNLAYRIGNLSSSQTLLRDPELESEFHRVLQNGAPYTTRMLQVEKLSARFGEHLTARLGLRTLSRAMRQTIKQEIDRLPLDLDANAFLRLVLTELSFCHPYGQKRSNEVCQEGCHFTEYFCGALKSCLSNRAATSIQTFARGLAWLLGDKQVTVEHLLIILPVALAHRIQWRDEYLAQYADESRQNTLLIHAAQKAVKTMHRRYVEQSTRFKSALGIASRIGDGEKLDPLEGEHPLYREIQTDLHTMGAFTEFGPRHYAPDTHASKKPRQVRKRLLDSLTAEYRRVIAQQSPTLAWLVEHDRVVTLYGMLCKSLGALHIDQKDLDLFLERLANPGTDLYLVPGPTGLFTSVLVNQNSEAHVVISLNDQPAKLHFLGYGLPAGKKLTLVGDGGDFVGAGLAGGRLNVHGSVGNWCGAGMLAGEIIVEKHAGNHTGEWMQGGTLSIAGRIGGVASTRQGGMIHQQGQAIPKPNNNGNV